MDVSYLSLNAEAAGAPPFRHYVDCDDELFIAPRKMTAVIDTFCHLSVQEKPQGTGAYVRCITESLVIKYRHAVEDLEHATSRVFPTIHLLGRASQDANICQNMANASGKRVEAGPVEATAMGNALMQLCTLGVLSGPAGFAQVVRQSFAVRAYTPADWAKWDRQYSRHSHILHRLSVANRPL